MQKIKKLYIKNVAKIAEVELEPPESGLITVCGKNSAGKTTLLRAIFAAVGGAVPKLRDRAETGIIKLELNDYTVSLMISENADRIKVEAKNQPGVSVKAPKTMLKGLLGKRAFDVPEFLFSKDKAQVEALLNVIDIPGRKSDIEKIIGGRISLENIEPTTVAWINYAHEQLFAERRIVDRRKKELKGALAGQETYNEMQVIDLEEIYKLKEAAQQKKSLSAEIEIYREREDELERQLIEIRKKISEITEKLKILEPYELNEIEQEIADAKQHNAECVVAKENRRKRNELEDISKESNALNSALTALIDYRNNIMSATKFPVSGLDIHGGKVYFNGRKLKEASGAEQMLVATAIAAAQIPGDGLQALFILDPPQLDDESWKKLEGFAVEKNIQIWIARVSDSADRATIYLTEGKGYGKSVPKS